MKISQLIGGRKRDESSCMEAKLRLSTLNRVSATDADGTGEYTIVTPGGMTYIPVGNEDAVVIPTNAGRVCIGIKGGKSYIGMEPGEVALYSCGGAEILLKNDGTVVINGQVFPAGE